KTLQRHVFRLRNQKPQQYQLLREAAAEGQTARISQRQVKFQLGGLLMKWSSEMDELLKGVLLVDALNRGLPAVRPTALRQQFKAWRKRCERLRTGCRLTAPDIRKLFDAIAKDRGRGQVDLDFQGQPNSIYARLKRNAIGWHSLLQTDK